MRKAMVSAVVFGVAVMACSSDDGVAGPDDGCSDISGNYTVTPKQVGGTCPQGDDKPFTLTISKEGAEWGVVLPGLDGACPGELDRSSCRFQAECVITNSSGSTVATYNVDYTFDGKAFTGSVAGAISAEVTKDKACTSNEKHTGERF